MQWDGLQAAVSEQGKASQWVEQKDSTVAALKDVMLEALSVRLKAAWMVSLTVSKKDDC